MHRFSMPFVLNSNNNANGYERIERWPLGNSDENLLFFIDLICLNHHPLWCFWQCMYHGCSLIFSLSLDRIPFNVVNFNLYGSFNCTFFSNVAICLLAILHYFTFFTGLNTVFPVKAVVHLSEKCLLIWFHLCEIWSDFRWKFLLGKTSFESLT